MHTNKAGEDVMHRSAAAEIAKKLDVSQDVLATLPSCIRAVRDPSPGAMYPSKSNCKSTLTSADVTTTHHLELSAGNLVPRTQNTASDRDHRDH